MVGFPPQVLVSLGVVCPETDEGRHPPQSLCPSNSTSSITRRGRDTYGGGGGGGAGIRLWWGGGGISRQVTFAVVSFAVKNFAEPLDFVWYPPPESTMCTAGVRELRGAPGFCVGNVAVTLNCEISHAKSKSHENPPV